MELLAPHIDWDLRTGNVDAVRNRISGLLRPFRLKTDPKWTYDARLFNRPFAHTGIAIIEYGREVGVEADPMHSFSLIQIPLAGSFELRGRGKSAVVGPNEAHVLGPATPLRMHWSPDCRLLVVRLDDGITRTLASRCRGAAPALFDNEGPGPVVRMDRGPGLSLLRIVSLMRDEAVATGSIPARRRLVDDLENLLVQLLVDTITPAADAHPGADADDYTAAQPGDRTSPGNLVERAKAYMLANLNRSISASDVADACGVSNRTLFYAFRKLSGVGPCSWLTERRLDTAHEALTSNHAGDGTVTEVALRCGFNHLGRFSASYRRRFGEYPSETQKRRAQRRN